ncbi:MAG: solute carrier family 23 protein [Pseudomonadota bacterium]
MAQQQAERAVRYEPSEPIPERLAAALGFQSVIIILAGIVLTPVIVLRAAGAPASDVIWAVFMAMLVSGAITVVQGLKVGRFGAGYILFMGTSGAFISVSIEAATAGGLALLATLVVASALLQFPLAAKLGLLRRIITPTVGGTAIMLIAVTVMPIVFGMLTRLPAGPDVEPSGAPWVAVATLVVILGCSIFANRTWRLWAPLLGIVVGVLLALPFGLVDFSKVATAAWVGLPQWDWPGFDTSFGLDFWGLLPAFLVVTLVGAIETFGDGMAIQRVSWRKPRAVDFRAVQGAVYADGLGNLLSGLGGTLPNTTYSTSIALVELTGVAARRVAIWGGLFLMALAFSPKLAQLLLAIPDQVAAAFIFVILILLFMQGLKLVTAEGLTYEKTIVVGFSFWLGIGFQDQAIFHTHLPPWAAAVLDNGMTSGTLVAILLTALFAIKGGRRRRKEVPLALESLPVLQTFLRQAAQQAGWDKPAQARLALAMEETLQVLLDQVSDDETRRLQLTVRQEEASLLLDLVVSPRSANLEDELAQLAGSDRPEAEALPFRILASVVEDLRHRQYRGIDFVTIRVASRPL